MAELNDKLITYGNLSTFYNKLQEQCLGGNAIEEVSELPNASENKSKLIRLDNGDKDVYVAKLLSSETIITTNRLPDEQQIDKAYLYEDADNIYYYKGAFKLICTDGEIDGYAWEEDNEWILFTKDNAVDGDTASLYLEVRSTEGWIFSGNTATTYESTISEIEEAMAEMLSGYGIGALIPATYNAPESAQIGNAYITDSVQVKQFVYDGTYTTITINGTTYNGYKWILTNSGYILLSSKKASDFYYYREFDEGDSAWHTYTDVTLYLIDTTVGEETAEETWIGSDIYIPQLNAPDSEQVRHATIEKDYLTRTVIYTGEEVVFEYNNEQITGYKWVNVDSPDSPIYSTKRAYQIYNTNSDSDDVHFYIDEVSSVVELTFENGDLIEISTVKYQRTDVTEEWDWQSLTDNATNDDIDLMFAEPESPVVKRVLMKRGVLDDKDELKYPLSLGEGLVNENDETMEWDGQTYYKWTLYEEDEGVSSIDYSCMGKQMIYLTTTLNPSLPFDRDSSECAYVITDGEDNYNGGSKIYIKEALIHEDGSITYEE